MTSVNSFGILIGAKEGDGRVIDKLKPAIDNNETDHEWAGKELNLRQSGMTWDGVG